MSAFPKGWFYIQSRCAHKMVLDVEMNSTKEGKQVILWPLKDKSENDNQLWLHEEGYLINKNSGLVLDVEGGKLVNDKKVIQYKRKLKDDATNQRWLYREDGFIHPTTDANLVLDVRGDSHKPGCQLLLYARKNANNTNQLWDLVEVDKPSVSSIASSSFDDFEDDEKLDDYQFSSAAYAL